VLPRLLQVSKVKHTDPTQDFLYLALVCVCVCVFTFNLTVLPIFKDYTESVVHELNTIMKHW